MTITECPVCGGLNCICHIGQQNNLSGMTRKQLMDAFDTKDTEIERLKGLLSDVLCETIDHNPISAHEGQSLDKDLRRDIKKALRKEASDESM